MLMIQSCANEGPMPSQLCPWLVLAMAGSSQSAYGRSAMGPGRADEAGALLARDFEEAFAGNGRAQTNVPTYMELRK